MTPRYIDAYLRLAVDAISRALDVLPEVDTSPVQWKYVSDQLDRAVDKVIAARDLARHRRAEYIQRMLRSGSPPKGFDVDDSE